MRLPPVDRTHFRAQIIVLLRRMDETRNNPGEGEVSGWMGGGAGEDGGYEVSLAEGTTHFELQPLPILYVLTDSNECSRLTERIHKRAAKTSPACADAPTELSVRTPDTLCIRP